MLHPEAQLQAEASPAEGSPAETLRQLIMGFRTTQLIHVAAKLGIADELAHSPRTARELATIVGAEPDALHRVLRALSSIGIFAETSDGTFSLTPLAQPLRSDATGSLRGVAVLYGEEWLWRAYGQMLHSVQTGRTAFEHVHGEPLFEYLTHHPAAESVFHGAMSAYSGREGPAIAAAYDFADAATVVDVGGGHGALVTALLRAHPHLSGVVYDLAPVVAEAERRIADAGFGARATCIAGDIFATVPAGADVYLLKNVLHDWNDDDCLTILRACRRAMQAGARLVVAERVVLPGSAPSDATLFDINMLVVAGGRERTEREHHALMQAAGLEPTRVIPTASALTLIEAVPRLGD
jgi:hypothetical protein